MRICAKLLSIVLLICISGCDEFAAPPAATPPTPPAPPVVADDSDDDVEEADEEVEREVAEVGVGKKGRNYGGGMVSEPIRAMFRTEQRLQLMQVKQAMQLYKAGNGYLPKTHEVFMKEIIEANSIQLPELPDGERYAYDPDKGELMVERPKK